jgi:hypothetical protein
MDKTTTFVYRLYFSEGDCFLPYRLEAVHRKSLLATSHSHMPARFVYFLSFTISFIVRSGFHLSIFSRSEFTLQS